MTPESGGVYIGDSRPRRCNRREYRRTSAMASMVVYVIFAVLIASSVAAPGDRAKRHYDGGLGGYGGGLGGGGGYGGLGGHGGHGGLGHGGFGYPGYGNSQSYSKSQASASSVSGGVAHG